FAHLPPEAVRPELHVPAHAAERFAERRARRREEAEDLVAFGRRRAGGGDRERRIAEGGHDRLPDRVHPAERDAHVGIAAIGRAERREREERRGVEAAVLGHVDDREDAAPRDRGRPLPAAHRDPTRPTAIAAASTPVRAAASASRDPTYA